MSHKREASVRRARELNLIGERMRCENSQIPSGLELEKEISARMEIIRSELGASPSDWNDWLWHLDDRITDTITLSQILDISDAESEEIEKVGKTYRWAVSPYYASLIDTEDPCCPIRMQSVPIGEELFDEDSPIDPMDEMLTSPVSCVIQRYPDRLIINVTNQCAVFCRHCQRRRLIGQRDAQTSDKQIMDAMDYIRENPSIRDVLVTGGDALLLDDDRLDWILGQLDEIKTVEIKRLGTRTPVTLPCRITPELCEVLSRHGPLYLNTQFNHPREITREAAMACDRLSKAGIPLGNQSVLLAGVNDYYVIQRKLCQTLLRIKVKPYYLFHCKNVRGISHFRTSVELGMEIVERLRGHTSGLAVPNFVINSPGGLGKVALTPNYIMSRGEDFIILRTWEMKTTRYENPKKAREERSRPCIPSDEKFEEYVTEDDLTT